jgi:hypothetical protein
LLAGDSSGFYDPYTGEGIAYALRGAELAAEAAASILNHRDTKNREGIDRESASDNSPPSVSSSSPLCSLCLCGSNRIDAAEVAALITYAQRRREEFGPRILVSRIIRAVLGHPWALEAAFRRFEAEPRLLQRLIGVTAGILPARTVLTPGYLVELFGLLPSGGPLPGPHRKRPAGEP